MTRYRYMVFVVIMIAIPIMLFASATEEAESEITLEYWVGGYPADAVQELGRQAEAFEQETGITVEVTSWPWSDFYTKLYTAIDLGQPPDVWEVGFAQRWASMGVVRPLTDQFNQLPYRDSFLPAYVNGATRDGEIWGVPRILVVWQIMINRQMFLDRGLDPDEAIVSWDHLLQLIQDLTVDTNEDGAIDQFGWGVHGGTLSNHYFEILMNQQGAPVTTETGVLEIQSHELEVVQALQFIQEQARFTPGGGTAAAAYDYEALLRLFAGEEIAMMATTAGNRRAVLDMNPALGDDIDFINWPLNNDIPGRTGDSMSGGGWIYISSASAYPEEAWQFIEFLQEPENAINALTLANFIPQRLDIIDNPLLAANPIGVMMEQAAQGAQLQAQHPDWTEMRDKVDDAIAEVLLGLKNPEDAARDLIEAMVEIDSRTQ